jgi:putative endonuclease
MDYYVYIMASRRNGTLYTGVTNNIARRAHQHKNEEIGGFTQRYKVHTLVYFEGYEFIEDAIKREKTLKRWHRSWKVGLIERENPTWRDLSEKFV